MFRSTARENQISRPPMTEVEFFVAEFVAVFLRLFIGSWAHS